MTALAALLERPIWELALGTTALFSACVLAALVVFWIGFRIAEVSALAGFEGMFGGDSPTAGGNARAVPVEVAARLKAIKDHRRASEDKSSLDELAMATSPRRRGPSRVHVETEEPKTARIDPQL